jgi:hypothetical protein
MLRPTLVLAAFALLTPGCIPVTEPVGDIDKAEPNDALLGNWQEAKGESWVVDRPEVKGNPKGLMRLRAVEKGKKPENAGDKDTLWFFTTTLGKHTYANVLLGSGTWPYFEFAKCGKEGEYAAWTKSDKHGYGIVRLELGTHDGKGWGTVWRAGVHPDGGEIKKLMSANRIDKSGEFYQTPAGWFAKHLEKNGPGELFSWDLMLRRP